MYPDQSYKVKMASSTKWKLARLRRSRKLPIVVFVVIVLIVLYHHSHSIPSNKLASNLARQPHAPRDPKGASTIDVESSNEEIVNDLEGSLQGDSPIEESDASTDPQELETGTEPELTVKTTKTRTEPAVHDKPTKKGSKKNADEEDTASSTGKKASKKEKDTTKSKSQDEETDHEALGVQDNLPKAPRAGKPDLDKNTEKDPLIAAADVPAKAKVVEQEPEDHLSLEQRADSLPDLIHLPFEAAVKEVKLEGWEDEWISNAAFDNAQWKLKEPKIDFVYLWVNGSEEAFQKTKRPYEEKSVLNDPEGKWLNSHGVNRYRDWDELRYSIRSIEKYASSFRNKIQIIVNSVQGTEPGKQVPTWLNKNPETQKVVEVLSQEDFFDKEKHACLPTFNSLTIENQLFNTKSETDYMYALSDDMLLGKPHTASDIHSPLFGPVMGFKTNSYNTVNPPTDADARRFGEKPFLIYTSWLLNRRFGNRKRKGQGHFGHALSRSVMQEAISSFPGPELQSACKRFRNEPGFQLYSWYISFHYLMERHREAMIWSYIMHKADVNGDGYLDWDERKVVIKSLEKGMVNEGKVSYRKRNFFHTIQLAERAGLQSPIVNTETLWTSLDGPAHIMGLECAEFDVNECMAPGFSVSTEAGGAHKTPVFATPLIFDRLSRQQPNCGDCLIKLLLNQVRKGLSPVLPDKETQPEARDVVIKALMRYRYTISNPDALFVMVTDAEQVDASLTAKYIRGRKQLAGQLCLNDDVTTTEESELRDVKTAMTELYQGLFPDKSPWET